MRVVSLRVVGIAWNTPSPVHLPLYKDAVASVLKTIGGLCMRTASRRPGGAWSSCIYSSTTSCCASTLIQTPDLGLVSVLRCRVPVGNKPSTGSHAAGRIGDMKEEENTASERIPRTMVTQHPDSASRYTAIQEEAKEAVHALSPPPMGLGIVEVMVDFGEDDPIPSNQCYRPRSYGRWCGAGKGCLDHSPYLLRHGGGSVPAAYGPYECDRSHLQSLAAASGGAH